MDLFLTHGFLRCVFGELETYILYFQDTCICFLCLLKSTLTNFSPKLMSIANVKKLLAYWFFFVIFKLLLWYKIVLFLDRLGLHKYGHHRLCYLLVAVSVIQSKWSISWWCLSLLFSYDDLLLFYDAEQQEHLKV